jgi:hypothetical protein
MTILTSEQFIEKKKAEFLIGKNLIKVKDISRQGFHYFQREALTLMPQTNYPEKVFIIERLKYLKTEGKTTADLMPLERQEYRIGYFVIGKIGNRNSRWTWGQYSPCIPLNDFYKLLKKAKNEGTIIEAF